MKREGRECVELAGRVRPQFREILFILSNCFSPSLICLSSMLQMDKLILSVQKYIYELFTFLMTHFSFFVREIDLDIIFIFFK